MDLVVMASHSQCKNDKDKSTDNHNSCVNYIYGIKTPH